MNKSQTIAKLEALLARVQSRAAEPRAAVASLAAAPRPAALTDGVRIDAAPLAPAFAVPAPTAPPPPPPPVDEDITVISPVALPPDRQADGVEAAPADALVELADLATEEATPAESLGSRERLVAAQPVAPDPVVDIETSVVSVVLPSELAESPSEILAAVEDVAESEEAPASSRRPVAPPAERIEDMAFGAEEPRPARHTPPPESGRLPASPDMEFDPDVTGVRDATPIAPRRGATIEPMPMSPLVEARRTELVAEATRPDLPASDEVASVVGEAQAFAPSTFAALLDASLAL